MDNNSFAEIFSPDVLLGMLDSYYPRLLTQIDRDPDSPTYGSCDRGFWMYRLHDFDSGVLQQAGLTFAALAALADSADLSRCRYLSADKKAYWEELARAINRRTLADFGRGGMVDEYYPGEQSFPATVFASYATLKSALMLGQTEVLQSKALRTTAETLAARTPSPAANQDTAGAAFLALYSQSLNWEPQRARVTVKQLVTRPEQGGNFFEYGGADLGYATVTLNYLGYLQADGGFSTADQLLALGDLIAAFITPSGNLGGEYASRSTTYFLPFGFLQAARLNPELAARFAHLDLQSAYARLDDRYLMHYCLPALARAALDLAQCGAPELQPVSTPPGWLIRNFPDVHLAACRRPNSVFFAGLNKGGAFQIEHHGQTLADAGYRLERGGQAFATCVVSDAPEASVKETEAGLELQVSAPFQRYGTLVAGSLKTIALRVLSFFGPTLNAFFKRVLIKAPQTLSGVSLNRRLSLDYAANTLTIEDEITGMQPGDKLYTSPAVSFRLVPSARFYQPGEAQAFQRAVTEKLDGNTFTRTVVLDDDSEIVLLSK